jgi:hypothetical protein
MKSSSPYSTLPPNAFWRTGVAQQSPLYPKDIYSKKIQITKESKVVTAGSCFAQHISRYLRRNGFSVIDVEPAPESLPVELHSRYGYSMYSARFGNIYTMRQLLQLAQEAFGICVPGEIVWEKDGGYYDALRPNVEPDGLESPDEVVIHREHHINRVRQMFLRADVFIFTLGLTEAWIHKDSGTVFPTVPGSIAGQYASEKYEFKNFQFSEIINDFNEFKKLLHRHQVAPKKTKFLLTVSPVPLTATNSGEHVLSATTYSKSVLRAVAGQVSKNQSDVDYFPSFEIINNCWSRGIFYANNMRSVSAEGVDVAMNVFLREHLTATALSAEQLSFSSKEPRNCGCSVDDQFEDVACEEALLEAFLK